MKRDVKGLQTYTPSFHGKERLGIQKGFPQGSLGSPWEAKLDLHL